MNSAIHAGIGRRIGSLLYDLMLLFSVLFFAVAVALVVSNAATIESNKLLFQIYLLAISYLYFSWFWTHGGQTLGMKSWRIRLVDLKGEPVTWLRASIRLVAASLTCGLGFLWVPFDKKRRALHDIVSRTVLIDVSGT